MTEEKIPGCCGNGQDRGENPPQSTPQCCGAGPDKDPAGCCDSGRKGGEKSRECCGTVPSGGDREGSRTGGEPPRKSPCCGGPLPVPAGPCRCDGTVNSPPVIRDTTAVLTFRDRFDHFLARWGVNRMERKVVPGLYRLNDPSQDSPVFVSANYSLSFDALRSGLGDTGAYLLVLDTKGINVWCAAGKGTFGTDEIVRQAGATGLAGIVSHRTLVVPQLGAPGVSAHEVRKRTGFSVEYGPVRASDLKEYLKTHTATEEMRTVRFPLADRIVLIPIEFVHALLPMVAAAAILWFLSGWVAALAAVAAVVAGTVLFPALLPYLPTRDFSTKGFFLGALVAVPFAVFFIGNGGGTGMAGPLSALALLLAMPAVTAYLALNFTGSSTCTSRTGVKAEIFAYVPVMTVMAAAGVVLGCLLMAFRFMGVA